MSRSTEMFICQQIRQIIQYRTGGCRQRLSYVALEIFIVELLLCCLHRPVLSLLVRFQIVLHSRPNPLSCNQRLEATLVYAT